MTETKSNLLETAFRWMFSNNSSGLRSRASAYYLSIGAERTDPDPDFLARFSGSVPPVKPLSDCVLDGNHGVAVDRTTAQRGIVFRIESLRVVTESEFEFAGGFYEASRRASGGTYTMKCVGDGWECTGARDEWLS